MMILGPPPPLHLGPELWAEEEAAGASGPPDGGLRGAACGQGSSRSSKHTGRLQWHRNRSKCKFKIPYTCCIYIEHFVKYLTNKFTYFSSTKVMMNIMASFVASCRLLKYLLYSSHLLLACNN